MSIERGTVVYADDSFRAEERGRPWVVINSPAMPFHGEQYVALTLSTKTWHDGRIPIVREDIVTGNLPRESAILPWAVGSIDAESVESVLGQLDGNVVDDAVWTFFWLPLNRHLTTTRVDDQRLVSLTIGRRRVGFGDDSSFLLLVILIHVSQYCLLRRAVVNISP